MKYHNGQKIGMWDAWHKEFFYGRIVKVCLAGLVIETAREIRMYGTFNRVFIPDMFGPVDK